MDAAEAVVRTLQLNGLRQIFGLCFDASLRLYATRWCGRTLRDSAPGNQWMG